MNRKRPLKLLCIVISVLMCLTLCVPAAFANEINGIYTSALEVKQYEEFNVYIHIPANVLNAQSLSLRVNFDPDAFEVTEWDPTLNIPGYLWFSSFDNTEGYFNLSTATSATEIDLSAGLTFRATVKARSNAPLGRYIFMLTDHSAYNSYYDPETSELHNISLWDPEVTYMGVNVIQGTYTEPYPVKGGGISVSQYALYPGNTFNVILNIPASRTASSAYVLVTFDSNAFDVVTWAPNVAGAAAYTGNGYFSMRANNTSALIDLTYGMSLYATLRVKDAAIASPYSLRLERSEFTYYDNTKRADVQLWAPQETLTNVTVYNGSTTTQPGTYPVIIPETTTTQQPYYPYPYIYPDYSDEIDYSEGIDPEKNVTPSNTSHKNVYDDTDPDDSYNIDIDDDDGYADNADPDDDPGINGRDNSDVTFTDDDDYNDVSDLSGKGSVSLDCSQMSGLSSTQVVLTTKSSFFTGKSTVIMTNTEYAGVCAKDALKKLGMDNHVVYPFDISVYNSDTDRYVSKLANNGYLELEVPVPASMVDDPENVEVFHIEDGMPESINRSIIYANGQIKIKFRADSFSPFMFVDISRENAADTTHTLPSVDDNNGDAELVIDHGYVPHNGSLNPNTGVAAAIIIPAAVTGCVFLARKSSRKRKRAKSHIDESDE